MRAIDADALREKFPEPDDWRDPERALVHITGIWAEIDNAPTIEPERKKGKWLCSDDLYETAVCSCCGWDTTEPWQHIKSWFEFCPHCGADMMEDQDG